MSNSIYNIPNYNSGTTYNRWDIVKSGNFYYYSRIDSNLNNTPSASSNQWGGTSIDSIDGEEKPQFIWKPSYNGQSDHEPSITFIKFGDGYSQRVSRGINNDLLIIDYIFDLRSTSETTAIIHFLKQRNSVEMFLFTPSAPYNIEKRFVCRKFQQAPIFKDNHSIKATFEEVAA